MVSVITTIILFSLIITIVAVSHEFSHYLAARITGMEVEEFAIGMGPVIWQKKHSNSRHVSKVLDFLVAKGKKSFKGGRGTDGKAGSPARVHQSDTVYMVKLIPVGGYVKILGEEEESRRAGSFSEKSIAARMAVACAGVIMNTLVGAFFFYAVLIAKGFVYDGIPYYEDLSMVFGEQEVGYAYPVTVVGVKEGSPAETAGFDEWWEILKVDGKKVECVDALKDAVELHAGETIPIEVNDENGNRRTVELAVSEEGKIGVDLAGDFKILVIRYEGIEKVFAGFLHEINMIKANIFILGKLIAQSVKESTVAPIAQSVTSPVGLFAVIDIVKKYGGVVGLLDLVGMFNVGLVIMNLLPFPGLDGGHVAFLIIEAVRGKPVDFKVQQVVFSIGLVALFLLSAFIAVKDVFQFGIWDWMKGLFVR